jgi:hypothetical protein
LLVELVELATGSSTTPCQDTSHDHDQDDNAGPLLLVELTTSSSTAPATITTKAAAPARLRWWNWWNWWNWWS